MRFLSWLGRLIKKPRKSFEFTEYKTAVEKIVDIKKLDAVGEKGLISVILPVYNGEDYLAEAVSSVIRQTYKKFELIIVDDGSNDCSVGIAEDFAKTDPRIRVIRHDKNLRLPKALNSGFSEATGEYYTWISHDNIMADGFLQAMKDELDNDETAAMVYGNMRLIDSHGKVLRGKGWYEYPPMSGNVILPDDTDRLNDMPNNTIGAAFMYRASAAKYIGEYSLNRFGIEDYDYWMRMNELFRVRHTLFTEPMYFYRFHNKSLTARDAELKITENRPQLMEFDSARRKRIYEAVKNQSNMNEIKKMLDNICKTQVL